VHAFQKKTQTTGLRDVELARTRWFTLFKERSMTTAKSTTNKKPVAPVESFASVWDALADTPDQAANLRARSELMRQITGMSREATGPRPKPLSAAG
jgi:hypothetical protein